MRRKTIITGLLFIILLSTFWLVNRKREEQRELEAGARQVFHFEPKQVNSVTLIYPDQTIICQRTEEGRWEMVRPIQTQADDAAIREIIYDVHSLRIERIIAEEKDFESGERTLSGYGLDYPKLSVHLGLEKGKLDTLVIGSKSHTTAYTFAARTNELKILLLVASTLEGIQKSLYDLRDKHLLDFSPPDVAQFRIEYEDQRIVCTRSESEWHLTTPIRTRGDQTEIDHLLRLLKESLATRFVTEKTEEPERFGLEQPTLEVTLLTGEDQTPRRLSIGSRIKVKIKKEGEEDQVSEEYFAKDASKEPIFMIRAEIADSLRKRSFDLRDRAIIVFEKRAVNRFELARGDSLMVCEKDSAGNWQMTTPIVSKAKNWRINGLLADLQSLRAAAFVTDTPKSLTSFGLDKPALKVRLLQGEGLLAELWVGHRKDTRVYVTAKDKEGVFLVDDDLLNELELEVDDLADRVGGETKEQI